MEEGDAVASLLPYPEDSAGHVMTTEVCALPRIATVADAREAVAATESADPYFYIFVVDDLNERRLLGLLPVVDLLAADPDQTVESLAKKDFISCSVDEDQEEVARKCRKYDLWVLPVLTAEGRLAGRITVDDVMDVVHDEADEDLARMVGAPDIDEEEDSPLRIVRLRLPWLVITVFAGIANSVIVTKMLAVVDNIVAVAVFVPVILAMGGNTGMQSSAIAVRGIALGASRYRRLLRLAAREVFVGGCLGVCCGALAAGLVWSVLVLTGAETGGIPPARVAFAVGVAMALAMAFASSFGSIFPILLHRLKIDPAVASGPFVTTSNDLSSAAIYFLACFLLL
jgi:magnesium transporter